MTAMPDRTLAATLTTAIRRDILSGVLPPGTALRQDVLAERYSVSRIPVREAIVQLAGDGLVDLHAHRGGVVSSMSVDEAEDIFHLRALIEPDLVARATSAANEADHAHARSRMDELERELAQNGSTPHGGELHRRFHRALYTPSGRAESIATLDRLHMLCQRYVHMHLGVADQPSRSCHEHGLVIDAFCAGDAAAAAQHTRVHIEETLADLRGALGRVGGTSA